MVLSWVVIEESKIKPWEIESKWYADIAGRILVYAKHQHLTLYQLSARSGLSYVSVSRYIREGRRMPAFALYRFAQVLGVSVSDLVGDTQGASDPP